MNSSYYGIIKSIFITNKKKNVSKENNKIYLIVNIKVNKNLLKQVFEKVFNLKVLKINTLIVRGKFKNKRKFGKMDNFKKSIFTINKQDNSEIFK